MIRTWAVRFVFVEAIDLEVLRTENCITVQQVETLYVDIRPNLVPKYVEFHIRDVTSIGSHWASHTVCNHCTKISIREHLLY